MHPADDKNRIHMACEEATDAFFTVIADRFPEMKTGDVAPDGVLMWENFVEKYVRSHLAVNCPIRPPLTPAQGMMVAAFLTDPNTSANSETVTDSVRFHCATQDDCDRARIAYPDGSVIRIETGAHIPGEEPEGARTFVMIVDGEGNVCDNYEEH
jgi:hypothetical protein